MNRPQSAATLASTHTSQAIRNRLRAPTEHHYLADAVLGGIDGCVTTFAVVAAGAGGALPRSAIVLLGLANLVADGFSMAASNYLAIKSEREELETRRLEEGRHITQVPEGEREEIRQIFAQKGFSGTLLEEIVTVICRNRDLWIDTMIREEHGLQSTTRHPMRAGLTTFAAFSAVGLMPLVPFLLPASSDRGAFVASLLATSVAFFVVGMLKGWIVRRSKWIAGLETLLLGGAAAALAYGAGHFIRQLVGLD